MPVPCCPLPFPTGMLRKQPKFIVKSLRVFSRLDEAEIKEVDIIHEGIESSLMILQSRLKALPRYPDIQVIKEYA